MVETRRRQEIHFDRLKMKDLRGEEVRRGQKSTREGDNEGASVITKTRHIGTTTGPFIKKRGD